jgi:hypothetical protein
MKNKAIKMGVAALALAASAAGSVGFVMMAGGPSGPPQSDMAIDRVARNEVIEAAIANLNRAYVFPEVAATMEKQLRARLADGKFDSVTSAEKFAAVLTDDLQSESHDKHLEVRYFEKTLPEQSEDESDSHDDPAETLHQRRLNYGFENVGRFRGNIGYIDIHSFGRPKFVTERIAAAMTLLADTSALIVDLRRCGGGDPDSVMLLASYLFDKRTHLNDIYYRDENRTEERWTTDAVLGTKYGETRKIYLLTSDDTFSGCEDFAYALKNAGRAIVVGATTGGGAHAGTPQRLSAHFMMFVPSGRPISPVTHTDWEGVGVTPNIRVTSKRALDAAQIAALKDLIAGEADIEWKQKLQECVADLD